MGSKDVTALRGELLARWTRRVLEDPAVPEANRLWQAEATKKGGTGLGLAIARGIVEAHGGEIGVERSGPGATFVFSIPFDAVAQPSASLLPSEAPKPS